MGYEQKIPTRKEMDLFVGKRYKLLRRLDKFSDIELEILRAWIIGSLIERSGQMDKIVETKEVA